jgi:hypothetical protein
MRYSKPIAIPGVQRLNRAAPPWGVGLNELPDVTTAHA